MPVVKSISKKNTLTSVPVAAKESATDSETANVKKTSTGEQKTLTEKPVKKEKESLYKENEKRISSNSVIEKEKSAAGSGRSSLKRDSETVLKKTPVKGPVTNGIYCEIFYSYFLYSNGNAIFIFAVNSGREPFFS